MDVLITLNINILMRMTMLGINSESLHQCLIHPLMIYVVIMFPLSGC